MLPDPHKRYDILIAGSGFAGSLTALSLQHCGFSVCLIEKGKHPRFAIGESSTPIADMILRSISARYNMPWLFDFSRYGSWQRSYPDIVCGLKRGFSYFKHFPGKAFSTTADHDNELLVAASVSDSMSDTHWLRADFDAFLVEKVKESTIDYFDTTDITAAERKNDQWFFSTVHSGKVSTISAAFFIDATGSGVLLNNLFSIPSSANGFLTHSFSVFSHFDNLPRWTDILHTKNISTADYPYDPDNSALHHVLNEGWCWALRFNDNRTSWGFVLNDDNNAFQNLTAAEIWKAMEYGYPDIGRILKDASFSSAPGKIIRSPRLQRRLTTCFGEGWVAMPHTTGFVDPLFSTGIAYSLAGVERMVQILTENRNFGQGLYRRLNDYQDKIFKELALIDLLVAGCFKTMPHFQLFNAWSMLYFTFTIMHEQRRLRNEPVDCFLEAADPRVQQIAHSTYADLLQLTGQTVVSPRDAAAFADMVKKRIAPFNTAGLLNPFSKNMYHHTAAVL